jgi:hypothetical protein
MMSLSSRSNGEPSRGYAGPARERERYHISRRRWIFGWCLICFVLAVPWTIVVIGVICWLT